MYIAFKWLLSMAMIMWIMLCSIDFYKKHGAVMQLTEISAQNDQLKLLENSSSLIQKNSLLSREKNTYQAQYNESIIFQYVIFVSGACLVLIYNRKNDIILYKKTKIKTLNKSEIKKYLITTFKNVANLTSVAVIKKIKIFVGPLKHIRIPLIIKRQSIRSPENINFVLLNKLKEYNLERKNLGRLLIAAFQENKNIRIRYQLETMAKKRLARNIEDTQKQMKDNRSRYVSFQQLYLITHQENVFLKSRVKKLTQEKEDAERNLIKLVNHVWQSKNNELKAYCSRFIVQTKNNLLNSDARSEIEQFIKRTSKKKQQFSDQWLNYTHSLVTHNEINEISNNEDLIALVKDAPKLRGLPGECVWTVKDKNGIIEKLYEYETEFDNGDTIRKIRQYSVYYDKDCLLDFSCSATHTHSADDNLLCLRNQYTNTNRITGSQAFQKFLQDNRNIVLRKSPSPLSLTY